MHFYLLCRRRLRVATHDAKLSAGINGKIAFSHFHFWRREHNEQRMKRKILFESFRNIIYDRLILFNRVFVLSVHSIYCFWQWNDASPSACRFRIIRYFALAIKLCENVRSYNSNIFFLVSLSSLFESTNEITNQPLSTSYAVPISRSCVAKHFAFVYLEILCLRFNAS